MYSKDDLKTAKPGDRIIAALISGLCGLFFGSLLAFLVYRLFGNEFQVPLVWVCIIVFGLFGFVAPTRSRDYWSSFWSGFGNLFGR